MTLQDFASNIAVGIVTALFLTGLILSYNHRRNSKIEKAILKSIDDHGMGGSVDRGIYIVFENKTTTPITVRTICLIDRRIGFIELKFKENSYNQSELYNRMILNPGNPRIHIKTQLPFLAENPANVFLLPLSGAVWECNAEKVKERDWDISECVALIEYPALFGGSCLLRVAMNADAAQKANRFIAGIKAGGFKPWE